MPKKKETEENLTEKKTTTRKNSKVSASTTKKTASAKTTTKKKTTTAKTTKEPAAKKTTTKKATTPKKTTAATNKKQVAKKTTTTKKPVTKKEAKKVEEKVEEVVETKAISKKVKEATIIEKIKSFLAKIVAMQEEAKEEEKEEKTSKEPKEVKTKKAVVKPEKVEYLLEYYDLPYRYNETVVKILAQTPRRMFVYWDISENDREKYIKTFGEDFFNKTYPVLLVYNEDKKYVREIAINDFANSWYIDIDDPKTKYSIQLGRKFKNSNEYIDIAKVQENHVVLHNDYLPFANSNVLEVPNDHVLLNLLPRFITFRNVKTNQETLRDLRSFKDIFGNTYSVPKFYNDNYSNELNDEGMFDMSNPSSPSSSSFK